MADVIHQRTRADLQFEVAVAVLRQQGLSFVDILLGIAAGKRPEHRNMGMQRSAEQIRNRAIQTFALQIQ